MIEHLAIVEKETYFSILSCGDIIEYNTLENAVKANELAIIIVQRGKLANGKPAGDYQFCTKKGERTWKLHHNGWEAEVDEIFTREFFNHTFRFNIISPDGQLRQQNSSKTRLQAIKTLIDDLQELSKYKNWQEYLKAKELIEWRQKYEDAQGQIQSLKAEIETLRKTLISG